MNRYFFAFITSIFLAACTPQQKIVTIPAPEMEFEQLDTMFVTARREDGDGDFSDLSLYRASHLRVNDLLHTKLDLRFNWEEEKVLGKASLKLRPYFYPTDQLVLDAKGFEFHSVTLEGGSAQLAYEYDGEQIAINLGRMFQRAEEYTININYTAKPSASGGSSAITSNKGLFFINPRGEEPGKPRQIWTQGETENNSRWFPTIDKPNERCTQEMLITVGQEFKTLSNGLPLSSTANGDGTRTDYWQLNQPHAPYLFMLAIGEFAVVEEEWEGIPVSYYVEPAYEEDAQAIFAHTQEMLSFFSGKLGIKYPWPKYAQVVVRDYVSGAMENTTAVIYGEFVQKKKRELIDNHNDRIVAHELFHHWFGDLATCESWSNLTMNEGFANYSEYLWFEHKYGIDEADYHLLGEQAGYLSTARTDIRHLIDFYYEDKDDMFDAHSYNKGGAVLHMLRHYVGDEAFWAGLNRYLTDNAYSAVEAHDLRLAFEAVTGEDFNWFFNQWFFNQGHPQLNITYSYDAKEKKASVQVDQTQDPAEMPAVFELPSAVDLFFADGSKVRHPVRLNRRSQNFSFDVDQEPMLILFDPEHVLLAEIQDNKTDEQLLYQYDHAPGFFNRYEPTARFRGNAMPMARQLMRKALADPFWAIRGLALSNISEEAAADEALLGQLQQIAVADPNSNIRSLAFDKLMELEYPGAAAGAVLAIEKDSAYNVIGSALQYLSLFDRPKALEYARLLENEPVDELLLALGELYAETGDTGYLSFYEKNLKKVSGFALIYFMDSYQSLAFEGGPGSANSALQKLQPLALDFSGSTWQRLAATRALNLLRQAAATDERAEMQTLARQAEDILQTILQTEPNAQLQSFYEQLLPDIDR